MTEKTMSVDEAVELIMCSLKVSREEARAELVGAIKSGAIRGYEVLDDGHLRPLIRKPPNRPKGWKPENHRQ